MLKVMTRAKEAQERVYHHRQEYHQLFEEYESAENDLNGGLGCIRDLVRDTTAASLSLSCGSAVLARGSGDGGKVLAAVHSLRR